MNRSCFALAALSFCLAASMLAVGNADDNLRSNARRIIGARYKICWVPVDQCKRKSTDEDRQEVAADDNNEEHNIEQDVSPSSEDFFYDQYVVDNGCYVYEDECGFGHGENEQSQINDETEATDDNFEHNYRSGYDADYDRELYGDVDCEEDLCGRDEYVFDDEYDEYWYGGACEVEQTANESGEESVTEAVEESEEYGWYAEEYQPYDFDYEDYWHEPAYDSKIVASSSASIDLVSVVRLSQKMIENVDVSLIQSGIHSWLSNAIRQVGTLIAAEEGAPSTSDEHSEKRVTVEASQMEDEESWEEWEDWYDEFDEVDHADAQITDEPIAQDEINEAGETSEVRIDRAIILLFANALDRSGQSLQEASRQLIRLTEQSDADVSSSQDEGVSSR